MKNNIYPLRWTTFLVLVASASLLLIGRKVGNLGFYLLLLLAIAALAGRTTHAGISFTEFLKKYRWLHLSMAGMFIAILLNQVLSQDFAGRSFDYPSRMALFVLLAWACLQCTAQMLNSLQWAYMAGALLCVVKMYIITDYGTTRGQYVDFMPIIEFADMTLLMGFFTLVSIRYTPGTGNTRRLLNLLKVLTWIATLYAAYISGTRGAWLAIPVLVIVAFRVLMKRFESPKHYLLALAGLILAMGLVSLSPQVQLRIKNAADDFATYHKNSEADTSVGTRLGLWKTSVEIFTEHPLIGIGRENFGAVLQARAREGKTSPLIARQIHSHNEIFYNMMTLGSFGLIGLLALYLAPGVYFGTRMKHHDPEVRAAASMGVMTAVGFFVFGLTDVTFMWGASDTFYGIFMAMIFAHVYQRERQLAQTVH